MLKSFVDQARKATGLPLNEVQQVLWHVVNGEELPSKLMDRMKGKRLQGMDLNRFLPSLEVSHQNVRIARSGNEERRSLP